MGRVSVIVPVFNGERYLAAALDSILTQSYRDVEIVVVDDGSTDGTSAVLGAYGPRVRGVRQENRGPIAARNRGIEHARGEFLAFLDADDLWHQEKLGCQMARFRARPDLQLSLVHRENIWIEALADEAARVRAAGLDRRCPNLVTMVARRELFDTVGRFDPELPHMSEVAWLLRARELGIVIEVLADVLVYRRLHDENVSRRPEKRDEIARFVKRHLDRQRLARHGG